ncbi:MAG: hypothetical protein ACT4OM_04560 [Actinomycetota bacterium]
MEFRAQPFYCPFCGEQDFVPIGEEAGHFYCESCDRRFLVKLEGLGPGRPAAGVE